MSTLETLSRFDVYLPEKITVHLDAGYDSAATRDLVDELGCQSVISQDSFPLHAGTRWPVECTNSSHTCGFDNLAVCTEVPPSDRRIFGA